MKKKTFWKMMPLAAGIALLAGCAVEQPEAPGPEAPPPPQSEIVPAPPNMTFVWTRGYWDWQGRWVWIQGYWGPRPHPGAIWVPGRWVHRRHHDIWIHPHWQ